MGLKDVVSMSTSADHTCARIQDGTVQCWGSSYYGQGGAGKVGTYDTPQMVTGL